MAKRILVVDASNFVRNDIRRMLETSKYTVLTAASAVDALAHLGGKKQFDAITLSVEMPKMSGFELCIAIRKAGYQTPFGEPVPIVFVTGHEGMQQQRQGFEHGCTDFITKASIREHLLSTLGSIIDPPVYLDGMCALVVEPNDTHAERLMALTVNLGAKAVHARTVTGAMQIIGTEDHWDLVLVAAYQTDHYASTLVHWLRDQPSMAEVPIIGVTQDDQRGLAVALLRAGASDYIVWPFSAEELFFRVGSHIDRAFLAIQAIDTQHALQTRPEEPVTALDILFAEDSIISGGFVQQLLSRAGHRVTWVKNGALALEAFGMRGANPALENFDLVLTDIHMPKMDGPGSVTRMRAMEAKFKMERTPIVALSATRGAKVEARCKEAGIDLVLTKRFALPELMREISRIRGPKPQPA